MNNQQTKNQELFDDIYLRGESVLINKVRYKAILAFNHKETNYLIVNDGKFNFFSLFNVDTDEIDIKNYMSEGSLLLAFSGDDMSEKQALKESLQAARDRVESFRGYTQNHVDPRNKRVVEALDVKPPPTGKLVYINAEAPYTQSMNVEIDNWCYTIDSHLRIGLSKYLITKERYDFYSLFQFTGKKTKELTLLSKGQLSVEAILKGLSSFTGTSLSDIRLSRLSGVEQSKQASKLHNKQYKL